MGSMVIDRQGCNSESNPVDYWKDFLLHPPKMVRRGLLGRVALNSLLATFQNLQTHWNRSSLSSYNQAPQPSALLI